jgi:hypothetical protein
MINVAKSWNPNQALLKLLLSKKDKFDEAIRLCLQMHSSVHTSEMSGCASGTYEDELWNGLDENSFRTIPKGMSASIAWNLWHLSRIEDITANILIADNAQVMNEKRLQKLNTTILDTGNAMTVEEIEEFSRQVNMKELRKYRIAVGRKTRKIVSGLSSGDIKRKMRPDQLKRIIDEGGVLEVEGSSWLIDFWGRKTVAGILFMPITRHQAVHMNEALRIKEKLLKKRAG